MKLFRCDYRCETTGEGGTLWVMGESVSQVETDLWLSFHKEGLSEILIQEE